MSKKIDLNCPACESSEIRFRSGNRNYLCRRCGAVFYLEHSTIGINYHVIKSPSTQVQKYTLTRKWGE